MPQLPEASEIYGTAAAAGARPDPKLSVSEWADKYRFLSSREAAEHGPWRTSRTPYLKEVMDCLSASLPYESVVLMAGAQIGKTEAGNNWLGYIIHQVPGPVMAVMPTAELAKRNSKHRIAPLVENTPILRKLVRDPRSRDSGNTTFTKEFPGGILILTGANSAVGLRSTAVRYLFLDEIDAYVGDVDGEGDPVELALARTRTFARRKIFKTSTPLLAGFSRIEEAFERSDQRLYWVPCPHCGEMQVLKFAQLVWPKGRPQEAVYACEHCGVAIENHQKYFMLPRGEWRPSAKGDGKTAGFHLSSLYSPVGWFSWADVVEKYEEAQRKRSPEKQQAFANTVLGETWAEAGEAPDWMRLYERREQYPLAVVPAGAMFLTAGVDVQKDRLEVQVVGWGPGKESWLVDYEVLSGDSARQEVWDRLTDVVGHTYRHELGAVLAIARTAVDSGYATQDVYAWSRKQAPGRVLIVKGQEHGAAAIGQPQAMDVNHHGKRIRRGVRVWPVATAMLKSELYGWLKLDRPTDEATAAGEAHPPGYCHFPQLDEEFFRQLTAEQLVAKSLRGYRKYEWVKIRERNEALDTRIYARAAAAQYGLDRFTDKHWDRFSEQVCGSIADGDEVGPLGASATQQVSVGSKEVIQQPPEPTRRPDGYLPSRPAPMRRVYRSNFLRW